MNRGVGLPEAVARFREDYRDREIPLRYDGRLHLVFTFGAGSLAFIACLLQLEHVRALEWLAVPASWLYANLAEYLGHRFPMHRPYRGLGLVYRRHAGQHHRFFNHEAMPLDDLRDLRAVLFPPVLVVFFFGVFGTPIALALAWLFSANVAWLFLATALFYFMNYEVLHLAYHLPDTHPLARNALVRRLGWLHRTHHDPRLMARYNFNISYPLFDAVFRTLRRD